jgi:hypothetical protein
MPGDPERRFFEGATGVPIDRSTWDALSKAAHGSNVERPSPLSP